MAPSPTKICNDSLEGRVCPRGSACKLRHDIVKCSCGLILRQLDFRSHVKGKRHSQLSRQAASSDRSVPPIVEEGPAPNASASSSEFASSTRCTRCRKHVPQSQLQDHLKVHDLQERLDSALEFAESNKCGFTIDGLGGVDFGIVGEEQKPVVRLRIIREGEPQPTHIRLSKCRLLSSSRNDQHSDRLAFHRLFSKDNPDTQFFFIISGSQLSWSVLPIFFPDVHEFCVLHFNPHTPVATRIG